MRFSEKVLKCMVERKLLKVTLGKIRYWFDFFLSFFARTWLSWRSKVVDNKVVFMTYNNHYICNPKYICEELLNQELPLDLVWVTTKKNASVPEAYPENVRLVYRGTYEFFKEVVTAKVWVDNAVCFTWNPIPKKKSQFYIETWHGSMGLKRIGKEDVKDRHWCMAAKLAGKWTNVCISNSQFETDVFRQTHWPNTPTLELGHARNDILFVDGAKKEEITAKVRSYFEIPDDKKIVLYAPTFRNNANTEYYSLDYQRLLDALVEKFGGDWVVLTRFLFKTKTKATSNTEVDERLYSATRYPDMQELMVAADLGITDYSSWICDFVLTEKPGFINAPDLSSYNQERGFYYPLSETPFPVAENNDEMESNIRLFDSKEYEQKCKVFLEDRGCREEGNAASKIADIIKEQCGLA